MATTPDIPSDISVKPVPLSREQRGWLEQAVSRIDEARMRVFNCAITSIHSPTGEERTASEWMVQQMRGLGIDAFYQPLDEHSGNAVGQLRGTGGGPALLLYAPIDTHLRVDPHEDVPWVGPELRPDMLPYGSIAANGDVIGLGSANPKGMITALTEAVRCIRSTGVPLKGDVLLAFAGGGMPSMPAQGEIRQNHGLSSGVTYMLNHGITADFAIICKPGCNAIVHAATFILALEQWLPTYQERNTSGLCSPQGAIAAIRGGWPHKPAFPTAATEVYIDLRCNPRTSPAAVKAQFAAAITEICAQHPELALDWDMYAAYPGSYTNSDNWIVQSTMRGWEFVEGTTHHAITGTSGQTDASALRNLGIPTVRLGYPPVPTIPPEWQGFGGLGVSHMPNLVKVTRAILYAIIDTCTRSRSEVGLD